MLAALRQNRIAAVRIMQTAMPVLSLVLFVGGPVNAHSAPTRVRHYTGNGRIATPCFATGDQVGVVFDLPPDQYPLQVTKIGISWADRYAHEGFSVKQGLTSTRAQFQDRRRFTRCRFRRS